MTLSTALPNLSTPLVIDAQTQPGWTTTPVLVVDGNGVAATGINLVSGADGSTVSGLVVRHFSGDGMAVASGITGVTISGNHIGRLTAAGTAAGAGLGNTGRGIVTYGTGTTIGGNSASLRNVVAGNGTQGHPCEWQLGRGARQLRGVWTPAVPQHWPMAAMASM